MGCVKNPVFLTISEVIAQPVTPNLKVIIFSSL